MLGQAPKFRSFIFLVWVTSRCFLQFEMKPGYLKSTTTQLVNRQGFVLIAVIWIAGLLAIVSTAFVMQVKSNTLLARNLVFNGKAEALADGMADFLAYRMSLLLDVSVMKPDGMRQYCSWHEMTTVGFRIQDQAGLIDLNTASPQLMLKFLKGVGLSTIDAEHLAGDLQDYRSAGREAAAGGTKPVAYAGRKFGPKNAPFETPNEVDQIPGVNEMILSQFQELATVYSQSQGIDLSRAPGSLKQILGMSGAVILPADLDAFTTPSPSKAFGIDIVVETREHARFYRRAVVAITQQPQKPFAYLSWEQGRSAESWILPKEPQPDCFN